MLLLKGVRQWKKNQLSCILCVGGCFFFLLLYGKKIMAIRNINIHVMSIYNDNKPRIEFDHMLCILCVGVGVFFYYMGKK